MKEDTVEIPVKNQGQSCITISPNTRLGNCFLSGPKLFFLDTKTKINPSCKISKDAKKPLIKDKVTWIKTNFQLDKADAFNEKEKEILIKLLIKYWNVISIDNEYGKTHIIEHSIETGNAAPIRQKARPLNPTMEEALKKTIKKMDRTKSNSTILFTLGFSLSSCTKKIWRHPILR